jgi:cell division transport system ATP-binding protein
VIQLSHVWKVYSKERTALADVSLDVPRGEFIFLTGPSGAGKSTLLRLIFSEELPTRGRVVVDGAEVTSLRARHIPSLRRKIGIVFQDFKLLPRRTVFENVALAARISGHPESEQKLRTLRVLKRVGLSRHLNQYPQQLSGGEQQRVALARAVVNDPPILLADEPTGNLDPELSVNMIELFRQINNRGTTVIVASHDRGLIAKFPRRVLALQAGRILSSEGEGRPFHRAVAEASRTLVSMAAEGVPERDGEGSGQTSSSAEAP